MERAAPEPARAELVLLGMVVGLTTALLMWGVPGQLGASAEEVPSRLRDLGVFGALGMARGAVLGLVVHPRVHGGAVMAAGGLMIGLFGWLVWYMTVEPLVVGRVPTWSVAAAEGSYRELVASVLQGALAGAVFHRLVVLLYPRGRRTTAAVPVAPRPRVVIVGGGFAGVSAARRFERLAARGLRLDVLLISASNFLLFTPMLAEVASGALQAQHISAPVRAAVPHTRFRRGVVHEIDTIGKTVQVDGDAVPYDHLVLAVGGVPDFFNLPGVAEHSFPLKSLEDAIRLRNHALGRLEAADGEPDPVERRCQLTFVVAGGGFAGTEVAAELADLIHGVLVFYRGVQPDDPRLVLVEGGERIIPEMSSGLGEYARDRLRARGVEVCLGVRVAMATETDVLLTDGRRIPARTLVWTAGNRCAGLATALPAVKGRGGAPVVTRDLRVAGLDHVWAIGDCAQIPGPEGVPHPPTAQHAVREGRVVADNIAAVLDGREPRTFRHPAIGVLVGLGRRSAAAEIGGRRLSGPAAWLLWRGTYLAKLPGVEKKARVLLDWLLDLAFPRDITVTAPRGGERR